MSKSKQPPRLVQKLTGWSYTRSLRFVQDNEGVARNYAAEAKVSLRQAYIDLAKAEIGFDHG